MNCGCIWLMVVFWVTFFVTGWIADLFLERTSDAASVGAFCAVAAVVLVAIIAAIRAKRAVNRGGGMDKKDNGVKPKTEY